MSQLSPLARALLRALRRVPGLTAPLLRKVLVPGVIVALPAVVTPARAAEVRGVLNLPEPKAAEAPLGYTRTRVTGPGPAVKASATDAAVFLKVKESLPLPSPSAKWPLKLSGLRFVPSAVACAIDEQIEITNEDKAPVTVVVGTEALQTIEPGGKLSYLCQQGGPRVLRVQEWPHMRGMLFIGEVGVSAQPREDGRFSLSAPQGTYELVVIGSDGPLKTVPVTVARADVDLGSVFEAPADPAKAAPPPPPPKPAAPPPPPKPRPAPAAPKPEVEAGSDVIELEP